MAGRPHLWAQIGCEVAAAVDRAAARLDFVNAVVAPDLARADTVDDPSHSHFGKPLFNALAARVALEEELAVVCEGQPRFREAFASCRGLSRVMSLLVEAVECRARKSSFTPDRQTRRLLLRAASKGPRIAGRLRPVRRNGAPRPRGSAGVKTWLVRVHEAMRLVAPNCATMPLSRACSK